MFSQTTELEIKHVSVRQLTTCLLDGVDFRSIIKNHITAYGRFHLSEMFLGIIGQFQDCAELLKFACLLDRNDVQDATRSQPFAFSV